MPGVGGREARGWRGSVQLTRGRWPQACGVLCLSSLAARLPSVAGPSGAPYCLLFLPGSQAPVSFGPCLLSGRVSQRSPEKQSQPGTLLVTPRRDGKRFILRRAQASPGMRPQADPGELAV